MITDAEPIYHLKDAAERCGVQVDTVKSWIASGLRAVPLSTAKGARKRLVARGIKPRDYLIKGSWLDAFLDARSRVKVQPKPASEREKPAGKPRRRGRVAADPDSPLGPCPC